MHFHPLRNTPQHPKKTLWMDINIVCIQNRIPQFESSANSYSALQASRRLEQLCKFTDPHKQQRNLSIDIDYQHRGAQNVSGWTMKHVSRMELNVTGLVCQSIRKNGTTFECASWAWLTRRSVYPQFNQTAITFIIHNVLNKIGVQGFLRSSHKWCKLVSRLKPLKLRVRNMGRIDWAGK